MGKLSLFSVLTSFFYWKKRKTNIFAPFKVALRAKCHLLLHEQNIWQASPIDVSTESTSQWRDELSQTDTCFCFCLRFIPCLSRGIFHISFNAFYGSHGTFPLRNKEFSAVALYSWQVTHLPKEPDPLDCCMPELCKFQGQIRYG